MKTALITGSETFGSYIANPTKWLALSAGGKQLAGYTIHSLVLPSVVLVPAGAEDPGIRIIKTAQSIGADVIVSFGMASDVPGFRIETSATNWIYNERYCTPDENNQPLDVSRPPKEQLDIDLSPWDFDKMKQLFDEAGLSLDPKISRDAGNYSCNSWMYRTLRAMEDMNAHIPLLFVHTACTQEAIELIPNFDKSKTIIKKEDTLKALGLVLQSLKTQ